MSEARKACYSFTRRIIAEKCGTKQGDTVPQNSAKFELYRASQWRFEWEPGSRLMYPHPPLVTLHRKKYWKTRYRVRNNGTWHTEGEYQYCFYTRSEIMDMMMG